MFKEKFEQVRDKFIESIEKFWGEHKEEISDEIQKKLGFVKPIKLYYYVSEIYETFEGLNYYLCNGTDWSDDKVNVTRTSGHGWYITFKNLDVRLETYKLDVKEYHTNNAYKFRVSIGSAVCSFCGITTADRVVELDIFNEYNAMEILKTVENMYCQIIEYRNQWLNYKIQEQKQEIYNKMQASELETIR